MTSTWGVQAQHVKMSQASTSACDSDTSNNNNNKHNSECRTDEPFIFIVQESNNLIPIQRYTLGRPHGKTVYIEFTQHSIIVRTSHRHQTHHQHLKDSVLSQPLSKMSNISINSLKYISKDKLADLVRAKSPTLAVIDVRDNDYIGGHIAGGQNIPVAALDYRLPELVRTLRDKDMVVFHCALSQQRGPSSALRYLRERERLLDSAGAGKDDAGAGETVAVGGQTVYVLEGGFVKWQEV